MAYIYVFFSAALMAVTTLPIFHVGSEIKPGSPVDTTQKNCAVFLPYWGVSYLMR